LIHATSIRALLRRALLASALPVVACAGTSHPTYTLLIHVESDPGVPLAGAKLASGGVPLGESDANGRLELALAGNPGEAVAIDTSCPAGYRNPNEPLQIVLRPLAEQKRPEFRVRCQPLKRSMVLTVRTQNGAGLPLRYLGKEIARTDDKGAAHALLEVVPGDTVTVTLDTSAPEHAALMPQNPELKTVVPERDEIVLFDQSFTMPKAAPRKRARPQASGPQKLVAARR
jgi:hypothetical protein